MIQTTMGREFKEVCPPEELQLVENQIPMKRVGEPVEIANWVAFLASDAASYFTSGVIELSGGLWI